MMQVLVGTWDFSASVMQLVSGSKPKTRIHLRRLREMRALFFCTCALLGEKAAPGWTSTAPMTCRRGGSVMQLETVGFFPC